MKKHLLITILSVFSLISSAQQTEVEIRYHSRIPMRDGITLSATIVKPKTIQQPLPTLFMLTPYIADRNIASALFFAKHDYVVVTVDTRGRGNSEGICTPFDTVDGKDGYDVCKWITEQSWSNGKIGMYGGSYVGMTQWQTLKENPPGLKTIVPAASVCPGIDFPKRNNIFFSYLGPYFVFISGHTANTYSFSNIEYWSKVYKRFFSGEIPFDRIIEESGISGTPVPTWLQHPLYDDYWQKIIPGPEDYKRFNVPILTITGYYDDDQHGAMHYYKNHLKYANPQTQKQHYLIIGPWDHGGTRSPKTTIGDLVFSNESVVNLEQIHLEWFDWTLKNKEKPEFLKDNVAYYIMGDEKWAYSGTIDLNQGKTKKYYLSSQGDGKSITSSGLLSPTLVNQKQADIFQYDPLNLSWINYDLEEGHLVNYSLYKNREVFKGEGLIYCSDPLETDMRVSGQIELSLYLEMDVKDADFEILLYELCENGDFIFLTTDYLRARYKNSLEKEIMINPGEITNYTFKTPYIFVRKIEKGSRIVLLIRNLNSPHYQKNFQSGKSISHETKSDAVKGNFKLYHNTKYPSVLTLPLLNQ